MTLSKYKSSQTLRSLRVISFQKIKVVSEIITLLGRLWGLVNSISLFYFYFTGAFGEVRKCSNRKTGAIRAVKIIRKDSLDAKEKARFF